MRCREAVAWLPVVGVPALPVIAGAAPNFGVRLVLGYAWVHCVHYTFKDTLNLVQGIGPFYYVVRDVERKRFGLRRAIMRETDFPWRRGQGLEIEVPRRTLQMGLCHRRPVTSEEEGLLDVLDGRVLEADVEEIGSWA